MSRDNHEMRDLIDRVGRLEDYPCKCFDKAEERKQSLLAVALCQALVDLAAGRVTDATEVLTSALDL